MASSPLRSLGVEGFFQTEVLVEADQVPAQGRVRSCSGSAEPRQVYVGLQVDCRGYGARHLSDQHKTQMPGSFHGNLTANVTGFEREQTTSSPQGTTSIPDGAGVDCCVLQHLFGHAPHHRDIQPACDCWSSLRIQSVGRPLHHLSSSSPTGPYRVMTRRGPSVVLQRFLASAHVSADHR